MRTPYNPKTIVDSAFDKDVVNISTSHNKSINHLIQKDNRLIVLLFIVGIEANNQRIRRGLVKLEISVLFIREEVTMPFKV